jgi:hypothetical protein
MRRSYAVLSLLVASLIFAGSAIAAIPGVSSTVSVSVSNGSLHYNNKVVTAKGDLVQINFTNDSQADLIPLQHRERVATSRSSSFTSQGAPRIQLGRPSAS